MRRTMKSTATAMASLLMACMLMAPGVAQAMDVYLGRKRPLLVFAPTEADPRYLRQKAAINGARTGFLDRDVVVIYVTGTTAKHDLGPAPGMSGSALRSRFRASEGGFRVLLVGQDGLLKLDSYVPLSTADLFSALDRMPVKGDSVRPRFMDNRSR